MNAIESTPQGELAFKTLAMPADTNANGDILGDWLLSQMDLAGGMAAKNILNHGKWFCEEFWTRAPLLDKLTKADKGFSATS